MPDSMFSSSRLQRLVAAATSPPTFHVSVRSTKSRVVVERLLEVAERLLEAVSNCIFDVIKPAYVSKCKINDFYCKNMLILNICEND